MKKYFSASFLICLHLGWVSCQQKVEQSPPTQSVQEGENTTFSCHYSDSASKGLQWFKKHHEKGLISLFYIASEGKQKGRLRSTINRKELLSSLYITDSQPEDSGTYLCAVGIENNNILRFGAGTRLIVNPNIQNPQPALYQLRSPKSSNTSVCLLTDFGFYNGSIKNETVTGSEATVLEMMTMESKSYGAVTWGSKSNFTCTDAFRKDMFDFNQFSGSKCNSSHAEQGFETDRDLNLMNLSLIVLRIIFLKTVGFNLLMTLRLWSN